MALLSAVNPTLVDLAKRLDPNGKVDMIAEILNLENEVLDSMVWVESNGVMNHTSTIRSGLPAPTWRKLYGGVQPTKSTTVQVTDTMGMLEDYAEVDKQLADLNGNTNAFRLSEDRAHIEGMSQEFAQTLFYGNEGSAPAEFTGLAPRFNAKSGAANGSNVLLADASASGADQSSVWLIVWGDSTVHGIYPKGTKAGLSARDLGEVTIENVDGANGRMQGYRSHYKWNCGLVVRDWRYIVRIANVDTSALTKTGSTGSDLIDMMTQALEIVPSLGKGKPAFYCSRTVRSFLRRQITNKVVNSTLSIGEVAGRKVVTFGEVPVYRSDAILNTEAVIS